jgi:purine-binding chemotaxis protein CheW
MEAEMLQSESYLTFRVGEELFAANVANVMEILELPKITKVPKSPPFMRGVMNLRGNVLPVIDTRLKFGLEQVNDTVHSCIMVLHVEIEQHKVVVGALVDAVQEVVEIDPSAIQPPPSIGSKYKTEFINGMYNLHDRLIMLLNVDRVFRSHEIVLLQELTEEKASSDT